jgi:DNA-directed RNA polymerase II subunit RPB1
MAIVSDNSVDAPSKSIEYFQFHLLSSDELIRGSAAEIKESKTLFGEGCVYDERLGPADPTKICGTCKESYMNCPGHFGHIMLQVPIIHPMLLNEVLLFLRVLCLDCNLPILSMEHLRLLRSYQKKGNYKMIALLSKKFPICVHCKHNQPTYTLSDGKIYYYYKVKTNRIQLTTPEIYNMFRDIRKQDLKLLGFNEKKHPIHLILRALPVCPPVTRPYVTMDTGICDDDITSKYIDIIKCNKLLEKEKLEARRKPLIQSLEFHIATLFDNSKGKARQINGRPLKGIRERINGKNGRIRNNMMGKRVDFCGRTVIGADPSLKLNEVGFPQEFATNLTIPETVNRFNFDYLNKLVQEGKANYLLRGDKTFNLKYALQKNYEKGPHDKIKVKYYKKNRETGERELHWKWEYISTIEMITKKPFVPKQGDIVFNNETGEYIDHFPPQEKKVFKLEYGDIVERHLKDGDRVLLNRQPTLHKGSILAPKIKILPGKTLRLPISICQSFNADFDGDEMNIHVPQSPDTRAEAETLVATEKNITTSQFPRPIIKICQDNLTAGYLMTLGDSPGESVTIDISIFNDALMRINYEFDEIEDRMTHIKRVLIEMEEVKDEEEAEKRLYTGYGLFSMLLPKTLSVTIHNKLRTDPNGNKEPVVIHKGVMIRGTLDATVLGSKSNSLVHIIFKDYSGEDSCTFVSHYQFITDFWLMNRGFSVGIADCMALPLSAYGSIPRAKGSRKQEEFHSVDPEVKAELAKAYTNVRAIMLSEKNPALCELKINNALNNVRDLGASIAKKNLAKDNSMKAMIESGSKGNIVNISQVIGLLGQQNVGGKRIEKLFRGRTFPHFPRNSYNSSTPDYLNPILPEERQYEDLKNMLSSRGFIVNSYIKGLTPIEFFTHQQGGREGLLSTAISTSTTGYLQRRIVKTMEDVSCSYLNTIVNQKGKVIQFAYGDDGMDLAKMVYVKGNLSFIDIDRRVQQLNNELENSLSNKPY